MDRRSFVKGAFGLVVVAAAAGAGTLAAGNGRQALAEPFYTTPATGEPETATGPLMMAGIDLVEIDSQGSTAAFYEDVELFDVDASGAALVMLADGIRSIEQIAEEAGAKPLDVALFFSSLCQAGYLRNRIVVSVLDQNS